MDNEVIDMREKVQELLAELKRSTTAIGLFATDAEKGVDFLLEALHKAKLVIKKYDSTFSLPIEMHEIRTNKKPL